MDFNESLCFSHSCEQSFARAYARNPGDGAQSSGFSPSENPQSGVCSQMLLSRLPEVLKQKLPTSLNQTQQVDSAVTQAFQALDQEFLATGSDAGRCVHAYKRANG